MTPIRRRRFQLFGGLLLIAVLLQFVPRRPAYFFEPKEPLSAYLAQPKEGWTVRDHPLGETEFLSSKARDMLQLDDFCYRTYQKGDIQFAIYGAFWNPGSRADIHTPDICWVNAGWTKVGADRVRVLPSVAGPTWAGQDRQFVSKNGTQYVVYWHLYGGRLSGQAMGDQSAWEKRAPYVYARLVQSRFGLREFEQYFVRVSSNISFDKLQSDSFFQEALASIGRFGLLAL